jgi:hypothetical protein
LKTLVAKATAAPVHIVGILRDDVREMWTRWYMENGKQGQENSMPGIRLGHDEILVANRLLHPRKTGSKIRKFYAGLKAGRKIRGHDKVFVSEKNSSP